MRQLEETADTEVTTERPSHPVAIPRDRIDPDAYKILSRLTRHGHLAYLVGGCVRDLILDVEPKDFDIATSAWPNEIKQLFRNCRIIGRRFRLAHILFSGKFIEVSTFRGNAAETTSTDRHDLLIREDNVFGSPEEDARRRDFTLNALFYDVQTDEVIDYIGGLEDIQKRMVRCIGDPQIRFREDPVRILRALRFSSRLEFECESEVHQAIADTKQDLVRSAAPRIHEEFLKTLACGRAHQAVSTLYETGVLSVLMPGVADLVAEAGSHVFDYLERLDQLDRGRRQVPDSLLLAFFLYPLYCYETDGEEDCQPWLDRIRETSPIFFSTKKRDLDRISQVFRAQRRFPRSARGRRFSLSAFMHKEHFREAWHLFEASSVVGGEDPRDVEEWRARIAEESRPERSREREPGPAQPREPGGGRGRRGRRRRRGAPPGGP